MRALLFLLFIIIVFVIIRFTLKRINQFRAERQAEDDAEAQQNMAEETPAEPEKIVACAQCDLRLPENEALVEVVAEKTHYFCCEAHLADYIKQHP